MVNMIQFAGLYIVLLVIIFLVYNKHPDKLIKYHKYSGIVDILAVVTGVFLIYIGLSMEGEFIWPQLIIGSCLTNIHIARFIIRQFTDNAFYDK